MKPKKKPKTLSNPPMPVYVIALPIPLLINNIINITIINKHIPRVISNTYSLSIIFSTYGFVLGNKNNVISSDQDLRVSYGFGINYYSPIGPIGFTWGFPLIDKDYDIKRMFLFSIGNIN